MKNALIVAALAAGWAATPLASACGGSSSSDITASPDGGTTGPLYTLDDVCDRTAPKLCDLRKSCCEKSGGFDQAGCIAHAKAECAKDVADARGGRSTFHPDRINPCVAKLSPLFDSCFETFDLILGAIEQVRTCRAFEGQLAEGATCERDSQCKSSAAAGELTGCQKDKLTCTTTKVLAEGAACAFDSGTNAFCGTGLYCDATGVSTCKKSTPVGSTCSTGTDPSLECGLGHYCDKATALCANGKGGGAICSDSTECASLSCASGAGTKKSCVAPKAFATTEQCKGP